MHCECHLRTLLCSKSSSVARNAIADNAADNAADDAADNAADNAATSTNGECRPQRMLRQVIFSQQLSHLNLPSVASTDTAHIALRVGPLNGRSTGNNGTTLAR